jgi:nucleoside phosphorylase
MPPSEAQLPRPESRSEFEIAIICALSTEASAVEAAFDEIWDDDKYGKSTTDVNAYTTGSICNHYVVLAYMPGMGKKNAASVAAQFRSSFPGIKLALLVGVCGGVPVGADGEEIILGDVVISDGVVEYDFGRRFPGSQFVRRDTPMDNLSPPRAEIRAMLAKLRTQRNKNLLHEKLAKNMDELCRKLGPRGIKYPGSKLDQLFHPTYQHQHHRPDDCKICTGGTICGTARRMSCQQLGCDPACLVPRQRLSIAENVTSASSPKIHFGRMASGDTVMKSGEDRDTIAKEEEVIAFEMESAGIWDIFPCLVIKGVCDYADSHKNKTWQPYAAAAGAACMRALLDFWVTVDKSRR